MPNNITEVRLLRTHLENDYLHTLYFDNKDDQYNFFWSRTIKHFTDFSYQRKDEYIRVPAHYDDLVGCNYVMYKNSASSNKWYYAFITDMKYVNEERTDVYIETDVIQTWLFDYTVKASFVEREHVNDDTVGLHTVPENVETGEYICNELSRDTQLQDYCYIVQVTEWMNSDNPPLGTNYGGVWSTGGAFICNDGAELMAILNEYIHVNGKGDAIFNVYLLPKKIVNNTSGTMQYSGQAEPVTYEHSFAKQTTLNGYTPKNNKLLCYPYNYILNSNNAGSSNILQYEHFSTSNCVFEIAGVPTVGGSIKCTPKNYKGIDRIQQEGIMLGKFPTTSWGNDAYTNWLTQNSVNLGIGVASGVAQIIGGAGALVTGGGALVGAGLLVSGSQSIANIVGQAHQYAMTPASAEGNINGGDLNTCYKMNLFYFYKMSIKKEYAQIIDEYFSMFGYKINRVKVPNKNHRSKWWFTKTVDVNIDGKMPMKDLRKIKDCYNRGITFWRDSYIGDYSQANPIVNV